MCIRFLKTIENVNNSCVVHKHGCTIVASKFHSSFFINNFISLISNLTKVRCCIKICYYHHLIVSSLHKLCHSFHFFVKMFNVNSSYFSIFVQMHNCLVVILCFSCILHMPHVFQCHQFLKL